ncbi:MAG: hypothetical protein KA973_14220 [Candidatus Microthrix sp.]|nr:hypothetical protein [Candidatus Microthrix sp.]
MTITAFLLARIAEDEARSEGSGLLGWARVTYEDGSLSHAAAVGATTDMPDDWMLDGLELPGSYSVGVHYDERRVLAECAAKRAIVEGLGFAAERANAATTPGDNLMFASQAWGLGEALRALASVYASHPDFDPAWQSTVSASPNPTQE